VLATGQAAAPESDAHSAKACSQDAALFCKGVAGGTDLHECLQKHLELLDPQCLHVEFEQLKAEAEDVAFNPKLKAACRGDIKKSCQHADAGPALLACLEDLSTGGSSSGGEGSHSVVHAKLSPKCLLEVGKLVKLENSDYRLSPGLEADCDSDLGRLCAKQKAAIDGSEVLGDGRVIDCLVDRRDEVRGEACSAAVKRKMVQRVHEAHNDPAMERDCGAEIEALCFDVPAGGGNLHRCLFSDHFNYLSDACKARELKYQQMKRLDVRLNPLLLEHCQPVLDAHCGGSWTEAGQDEASLKAEAAKAMACLEEHMESAEATPACRSRVLEEPILRSKSLLLNPDLQKACSNDLTDLAAAGKCDGGKGKVISLAALKLELSGRDVGCLLSNEALVAPLCATALLSVKRARSKDLRANPGGLGGCRGDVDRFCVDEPAGDTNRCLQGHLGVPEPEALSMACAALQTDILLDEARDFIANPFMERACRYEASRYCSGVADGQSRIQTCLTNQAAKDKASVSSGCMAELERVWFSVGLANGMLALASPGFFVGLKDAFTLNWLTWLNALRLLKVVCGLGMAGCGATVLFLHAGNYQAASSHLLLRLTALAAPYTGGATLRRKAKPGGRVV
jgi:hypothetical protein